MQKSSDKNKRDIFAEKRAKLQHDNNQSIRQIYIIDEKQYYLDSEKPLLNEKKCYFIKVKKNIRVKKCKNSSPTNNQYYKNKINITPMKKMKSIN